MTDHSPHPSIFHAMQDPATDHSPHPSIPPSPHPSHNRLPLFLVPFFSCPFFSCLSPFCAMQDSSRVPRVAGPAEACHRSPHATPRGSPHDPVCMATKEGKAKGAISQSKQVRFHRPFSHTFKTTWAPLGGLLAQRHLSLSPLSSG